MLYSNMPYSLETIVFQFRISRYMSAASLTLWAYDFLLTISDEFELLWSRNGLTVKVLYLIGRYLPIVEGSLMGNDMIPTWQPSRSNISCRISFAIIIACTTIQSSVSMSIFTMRLCLIYAMQPTIRRILVLCLSITIMSFVAFQVLTLHHALPLMSWNAQIHLCLLLEYETWALGAAYITPIFMESVIFILTLLHALDYYRTSANVNKSTKEILRRLYVDGTQYYLLLLAFRLGTVLVYYLAPPGLQLLFNQFEYFVSSTLTSRFFLSFRRQIINSQTMQPAEVDGLGESVSVSAHIRSPGGPETRQEEKELDTLQSA